MAIAVLDGGPHDGAVIAVPDYWDVVFLPEPTKSLASIDQERQEPNNDKPRQYAYRKHRMLNKNEWIFKLQ